MTQQKRSKQSRTNKNKVEAGDKAPEKEKEQEDGKDHGNQKNVKYSN